MLQASRPMVKPTIDRINMKHDIMLRDISGIQVSQRISDGYVNATHLLKAHKAKTGEAKKISDWIRLDATKSIVAKLSDNTGIPALSLIQQKKGKNGGTWIHPRMSVRLAMWISDDFSLQVEDWVREWMMTGQNPIAKSLTREEVIASLLPSQPLAWQCRYTPLFWKRLEELYGYRQGNPACAIWINRFVYGYFPQEIRDRLDEINPLIEGKRKRLQHTHFDGELLASLERHLSEVLSYLMGAASQREFERLMDARFKGIYQLQVWRAA